MLIFIKKKHMTSYQMHVYLATKRVLHILRIFRMSSRLELLDLYHLAVLTRLSLSPDTMWGEDGDKIARGFLPTLLYFSELFEPIETTNYTWSLKIERSINNDNLSRGQLFQRCWLMFRKCLVLAVPMASESCILFGLLLSNCCHIVIIERHLSCCAETAHLNIHSSFDRVSFHS